MNREGLLIVCALEVELVAVVRGLGLERVDALWDGGVATYGGTRAGEEMFAVACGMGGDSVREVLRVAMGMRRFCEVVLVGLAGGLRDGLGVGDVVRVVRVVDAVSGEVFEGVGNWENRESEERVGSVRDGGVVTVREAVTGAAEKRALGERFGVDLVDMEAAGVARFCRDEGVAWRCLRVVSDGVDDVLPPFVGALVDGRGRAKVWAAVGCLLVRPWWIGGLLRLGRDSRVALGVLSRAVGEEFGGKG